MDALGAGPAARSAWMRAVAIAVAAIVMGLIGEHLAHSWEQPAWIPIADLGVGWLMVGCGLVAWMARPEQPAGARLTAAGFLWFVGTYFGADAPIPQALGFAFTGYYDLVLLWLALSFPDRMPMDRVGRWAVVIVGVLYALQSVARLLMHAPDTIGVDLVDPDAILGAVLRLDVARAAALVAAGFVAIGLLVRRSPAERRGTGLVLGAGAASSIAGGFSAWYALTVLGLVPDIGSDAMVNLGWSMNLIRVAVPLAILAGILRSRADRSALVAALQRVGPGPSLAGLQGALASALGDPSLQILAWDPATTSYVDPAGNRLPDAAAAGSAPSGRTVVPVTDAAGPVALLVVDRRLADDPALIGAGVSIAGMVIRNDRLSTQVEQQLEDVRASRARMVDAADRERQRIERDLHDGVQQRMVALAMSLRAAESAQPAAGAGTDAMATTSVAGSAELLAILQDLRELARGIHPPVLAEAGLTAAIRSAADRSPIPAETDLRLTDTGSPAAQATAYFVVSEALANAAKHASGATTVWVSADDRDGTLRVSIEDDGPGGADPAGHGLTGLADRVAAMGGTFRVDERAGGGTRVAAVIPR